MFAAIRALDLAERGGFKGAGYRPNHILIARAAFFKGPRRKGTPKTLQYNPFRFKTTHVQFTSLNLISN